MRVIDAAIAAMTIQMAPTRANTTAVLRASSIDQASAIEGARGEECRTPAGAPKVAALVSRCASSRASTFASSIPCGRVREISTEFGEEVAEGGIRRIGRRHGRPPAIDRPMSALDDVAPPAMDRERGSRRGQASLIRLCVMATSAVVRTIRPTRKPAPSDSPRKAQGAGGRSVTRRRRPLGRRGCRAGRRSRLHAVRPLGDIGEIAGLVGTALCQRVDLDRQVTQAACGACAAIIGLRPQVGERSSCRVRELGAGVVDDAGSLCGRLVRDACHDGLYSAFILVGRWRAAVAECLRR